MTRRVTGSIDWTALAADNVRRHDQMEYEVA